MDISALAKDIVPFLTPFLPYLLKAGEKASEEAGKQLGTNAWEKAKALWSRFRPKMETRPAIQEAAQDVANSPADEDAQAAFRLQLKKLLSDDDALASDVTCLWEEAKAAGVTIIAAEERSVAAQKITSSTIITGDQNRVKS